MSKNQIWVRESPFYMTAGESIVFSYVWEGTGSAVSGSDTKVYLNGVDKSSSYLSGSSSQSGRTTTCETFAPTEEGTYVLVIQATVDGNTEIRKCLIYVQPAWMEQ